MKKKLGPLELWQWAAIGAAAGLLFYLYSRRAAAGQAAAVGATPAAAQYDPTLGPIDPTTGLPFASSGGGGGDPGVTGAIDGTLQGSGQTTLAQELSDLGLIESLLAGMTGIAPPTTNQSASSTQDVPASSIGTSKQPAAPAPGFHADHSRGHEYYLPGTGWVSKARYAAATAKKTIAKKPKHNPGHTVKTHTGGKHTASSTAPHNSTQHHSAAPPSHQRHEPTKHPSTPRPHIVHGTSSPAAVHPGTPGPAQHHAPAPRRKPKRKRR